MSGTFLKPAPGFDQAIAVLKHRHDCLRRQSGTLRWLNSRPQTNGANSAAQQAAQAAVRYFSQAAPNHPTNQEVDLLPALEATTLQPLLPQIREEHQQMDVLWNQLAPVPAEIGMGHAGALPESVPSRFAEICLAHRVKEETVPAPMAKRILDAAQTAWIGAAMQARRGIAA